VQNLEGGSNVTITDLGSGNVRISATGGVTPPAGLPRPDVANFHLMEADPSANSPSSSSVWISLKDYSTQIFAGDSSYSLASPTATDGWAAEVTVTAHPSSTSTFATNNQWAQPARKITFLSTMHAAILASSSSYVQIGMASTTIANVNPTSVDCAGISFSVNGSLVSNFFLVSSNSGSVTSVDLGISANDGLRHEIGFVLDAGVLTAIIDGIMISGHTVTTNLPTSLLGFNWWSNGVSGYYDPPSCTVKTEYMYAENVTP
jgi:hypothetical protein